LPAEKYYSPGNESKALRASPPSPQSPGLQWSLITLFSLTRRMRALRMSGTDQIAACAHPYAAVTPKAAAWCRNSTIALQAFLNRFPPHWGKKVTTNPSCSRLSVGHEIPTSSKLNVLIGSRHHRHVLGKHSSHADRQSAKSPLHAGLAVPAKVRFRRVLASSREAVRRTVSYVRHSLARSHRDSCLTQTSDRGRRVSSALVVSLPSRHRLICPIPHINPC